MERAEALPQGIADRKGRLGPADEEDLADGLVLFERFGSSFLGSRLDDALLARNPGVFPALHIPVPCCVDSCSSGIAETLFDKLHDGKRKRAAESMLCKGPATSIDQKPSAIR